EEREEREARDRVERPAHERDRRIELWKTQRDERQRKGDREANDHRDRGQLEVLAHPEADLAGVTCDPVPTDDRLARGHDRSSVRSSAPMCESVSTPR